MTKTKLPAASVFYIPAGIAFVDALAKAILDGNLPHPGSAKPSQFDLANWTILLPTRRATRGLMQAFVEQSANEALLLPRIAALGDVDEDELAFADLPNNHSNKLTAPAISTIEREFVLVSLIKKWAKLNSENELAQMLQESTIHAFYLARSLGKLVDDFETSGVKIDKISSLFEGEFAAHRHQILGFLSIIEKQLPEQLMKLGKLGPAEYRNIQMRAYNEFLASGKAGGPVIAAGSTGSIPATAELLSTISKMTNGAVVLPGLDTQMDDASWEAICDNHPQFGMRELLQKMGIERCDVKPLCGTTPSEKKISRNWLASEIMRPSQTTDQWRASVTDNKEQLTLAIEDLEVLEAKDQRAEAVAIALVFREAAERGKSAALVTPDRSLARAVKAELKRWEMEIDDSAGISLAQTPEAIFFDLLLDTAEAGFTTSSLKALLAHPFCTFGYADAKYSEICAKFEAGILRSDISFSTLDELEISCTNIAESAPDNRYLHPFVKQFCDIDWQEIVGFCTRLTNHLRPLEKLFSSPYKLPLSELIKSHLHVGENISQVGDGAITVWNSEAGRSISDLFSRLLAGSMLAPELTGQEYSILLREQIRQAVVRPSHVSHARLNIYGLLEARLASANIMVLGGLNETVWPAIAQSNTWLTRPQLNQAGLTLPERKIGLSAHDFVQGLCAQKVILTYSKKRDGSPAVPARWILRFQALVNAAGMKNAVNSKAKHAWLDWAGQIDKPERFSAVRRPLPMPAIHLRPTTFSVTGIEKLVKNPYRLYAEKILKLAILPPLISKMQAAERGNLVHQGLQNFISKFDADLPNDAKQLLFAEFESLLNQNVQDMALRVFWEPQLRRMSNWFVNNEIEFRKNLKSSFTEVDGNYDFHIDEKKFRLTARADRIDVLTDGRLRIIDYKTGEPPSFNETTDSFSPQLFLEAIIAINGEFKDVSKADVESIVYVKLSGGDPAGNIKAFSKKIPERLALTEVGLVSLLCAYNLPRQPYQANPHAERPDQEREYDYLSRWREWGHLIDEGPPS